MNDTALLIGIAVGIAFLASRKGEDAPAFPDTIYAGDSPVALAEDMSAQNLSAFLALIRKAEARDDYGALFGGGSFDDFSDHPANLGWAGLITANGPSTAAGAYQITQTTYNGFRQSGWRRGRPVPPPNDIAPDFSPDTQDHLATRLIARRGALDSVSAGDFQNAVVKLRGEWEAFDRMLTGTYPMTLAQAQDFFVANGGTIV